MSNTRKQESQYIRQHVYSETVDSAKWVEISRSSKRVIFPTTNLPDGELVQSLKFSIFEFFQSRPIDMKFGVGVNGGVKNKRYIAPATKSGIYSAEIFFNYSKKGLIKYFLLEMGLSRSLRRHNTILYCSPTIVERFWVASDSWILPHAYFSRFMFQAFDLPGIAKMEFLLLFALSKDSIVSNKLYVAFL